MKLSRLAYAVGVLALIATPAWPQQANAVRLDAPVRIQSSINFFVFGPTGDGEEASGSATEPAVPSTRWQGASATWSARFSPGNAGWSRSTSTSADNTGSNSRKATR